MDLSAGDFVMQSSTGRVVVALFGLLLAPVLSGCGGSGDPIAPAAEPAEQPNIVLIMIDTLRPDYLDLNGYPRETAPFLKRLASESTVFENAFSTSSWTAPATASAITSLYPTEHGLQIGVYAQAVVQAKLRNEKLNQPNAALPPIGDGLHDLPDNLIRFQTLSPDLTTVAEILQSRGYATYGISTNINVSAEMNFDQGFDHFYQKTLLPAEGIYAYLHERAHSIRQNAPYFLYIHLMDPHTPYHPRKPYFQEQATPEEQVRETYLSEIRYMDDYLAMLFDEFEMDANTLVAVITDHGEEFWDHGNIGHGPSLYGELNDVLMLYFGPDLSVPAQRVPLNVSLIDVIPTMLDLAGVEAPELDFSGTSLLPVVRQTKEQASLEAQLGERVLFAQRVVPTTTGVLEIWAAMLKERKLIVDPRRGRENELFDLAGDPAEKDNLAEREPAMAASLQESIEVFLRRDRIEGDVGMLEMSEDLEDELEALGYMH